jgi:DNA-binding response OmpR family regulator
MTKILIITKEIQLARTLNYSLTFNGFIVECAPTPIVALQYLKEIKFSLVLIDFNFKASNGNSFYQELQDMDLGIPVIAMGECYEELSIIEKMYHGVDDYILKPFALSELKMIVNKQLERTRFRTKPIVVGELKIDVARSLVTVKDTIVSLGKKELEVLIILAHKAGKIVTTDTLMTRERMRNLKKKLQTAAGETLQIKSVGLGYKLILSGH